MSETMMCKATFSEICKIMNHKDGKIHDCIKSIIRLSLLLFPGMMCKDLASVTALESGLLTVDVTDVIDSTICSIKTAFGTKHEDFTTRAQDAQIAHVLIVFAAYFDSIKIYLPDANNAIKLSNKEKLTLTQESIEEYINFLTEQAELAPSSGSFDISEYPLPIPNPVEGFSAFTEYLKSFYEILNSRFLDFVGHLSYIENMPRHKQDRFHATLRNIPVWAVKNYKNQYYELSASFPDFFVWATQKEHEALQHTIDVGFKGISSRFDNIAQEISSSTATRGLSILHNRYVSKISNPVVSHSDMPLGDNDIHLPTIETSFIPQAFKALIYRNNLSLDDPKQWVTRYEIGRFIADTLRSPDLGSKPLLVLGDPGAGKTMLCHMLAAKILYNEYHVIILHLRNLNAESEIYEQINQALSGSLSGLPCTWGDIAYANLNKPILLIFDGYDELLQASGKTHSNYLEKIASFQESMSKESGTIIRAIVTSRIVLIDKAQIPNNSVIIRLEKFDDERIDLWCKIWNQHNSDYFARNHIDPFSVTQSSKALGLATQPLLLLMLALFDSNGNALREHQDLSAVELYNSLIRDFIVREQKKNPVFCQKEVSTQRSIVDQEVERISIAALGMYNRNLLYIRASQLEEDLNHLSITNGYNELHDSDKLLGSFFFLRRSESVDTDNTGDQKLSAYEFLHNTFGEFLTAYYFTLKIYDLLMYFRHINEKHISPNMQDKDKWYASFSYTPLFHRPVVAEMIFSWAPIFFKEKGLSTDAVQEALLLFADFELPRIYSGSLDVELPSKLQKFNTKQGYPEFDNRTYVAVYSINFVSVLTLLLNSLPLSILEKHDNRAWEKLLHIWKYSFTEDELTKFAYCFHVLHNDAGRIIEFRIGDPSRQMLRSTDFGPYKSFQTYMALDEELEYSALGLFYGFEYDSVNSSLKRQKIPVRVWNALKSIVDQPGLFTSSILHEDLCLLDDIFEFAIEENDEGAFIYGLLLLKYLTDPGNSESFNPYGNTKYSNVGWLCFAHRHASNRKNHSKYPTRLIILEILNQIPFNIDTCEIICRELFPYKFRGDQYSLNELYLISLLGQRIIKTYLQYDEQIPLHLLDSFIQRITDTFEMIAKYHEKPIPNNVITEFLRTTTQVMRHCEDENAYHLMIVYRDYLQQFEAHDDFHLSTKQACLLIDALYLYHKDGDQGSRLAVEIMPHILSRKINAIDLFDCHPSSIEALCNIMTLFPHDIGVHCIPMLIDLVNERAESITFGLYKLLSWISHVFSSTELYDALADKLNN